MRVIPTLPAWIPAHPFLSCVFGAIQIAACAAIRIEKVARSEALLMGVFILSPFALLPALLVTTPLLPFNGRLWTMAGKAPALSGKFMVFE